MAHIAAPGDRRGTESEWRVASVTEYRELYSDPVQMSVVSRVNGNRSENV